MTNTWIARLGVVAAVSILSAVITHAAQPAPPPLTLLRDSRLFTTGTVGSGTARSVAVPDLGTITAVCSATGDATVTLTGRPVFDWFVATDSVSNTGMLTQIW